MNNNYDFITCGISWVFTAVQTNELFQLISIILSCIATVVTLVGHITMWVKNAKKDGKITADEIKELTDTVTEDINDIKKNLEDK